MLDFPASPVLNQQFSAAGSSWVFDGTAWNIVPVMTAALASDTPPSNPAPNQMWWRASNGQLYLWYDDGNTKQWVQAAAPAAAPITPPRAWEQIYNGVVTNVAEFKQVNLSAFHRLRFAAGCLPASTAAFYVQISIDNGVTWANTAGVYTYQVQLSTSTNISTAQTASTSQDLCSGSTPGLYAEFNVELDEFNTTQQKTLISDNTLRAAAGLSLVKTGGYVQVNAVANAMHFYTSGPTFSGHMLLEGVRG